MKLYNKIILTILLLATLLCAMLLWETKEEWMPSMSAFALSNNVSWYILMHCCMILFWFWDSSAHYRPMSSFIGFANIGILAFNMYDDRWLHNGFTFLTVLLAVISLIYYSSKKNKPHNYFIGGVVAIIFVLGLTTSLHLFLAEAIVIFCIGVGKLREIWSSNKLLTNE